MEWLAFVIAVIALIGLAWSLVRGRTQPGAEPARAEVFQRLENQMSSLQTNLLNQLSALRGDLTTSLTSSGETLRSLGTQLGTLQEATRRMQEIGRDIASLQELLRPPKIRGELGELLLQDLLAQCLPKECYRLQHQYRDGTKVDALICLTQGSIPVDAKFPLESFARLMAAQSEEEVKKASRELASQVKGHIDSVAGYIRTAEGTFDFALMYIPAENVYYEVAVKGSATSEVMKHALGKRVFPVSPNTFYAYLQAIALGLRGLQIEKWAKDIYAQLGAVKQALEQFQEEYRLVGKNIRLASEHYNESLKPLYKSQQDLAALGQGPSPVQQLTGGEPES